MALREPHLPYKQGEESPRPLRLPSTSEAGDSSVRVALAYNAKPDARREIVVARPELVPDEEEEPPPLVTGVGAQDDVYAEWDDTLTILALADALGRAHDVVLIEADSRFPSRVARCRPDLVFNVAEGMWGPAREAQVPAVLEMLGIPYTGSDALTLAICLHKAWANTILRAYGVPTPRHSIVTDSGRLGTSLDLTFPVIVKPVHEGSSKGIRDDQVVHTPTDAADRVYRLLREYRQPVLVEEFLPGREFTVAILGNLPSLQILPPVEIRFDNLPPGASPIYSWEAKWRWDRPDAPLDVFECPAHLSPHEREALEWVVRKTVETLRINDWARIDLRMSAEGVLHVIEVNPLPGMLPDPDAHSCFPKAARAAGLSYDEVILGVVEAALTREGSTV